MRAGQRNPSAPPCPAGLVLVPSMWSKIEKHRILKFLFGLILLIFFPARRLKKLKSQIPLTIYFPRVSGRLVLSRRCACFTPILTTFNARSVLGPGLEFLVPGP